MDTADAKLMCTVRIQDISLDFGAFPLETAPKLIKSDGDTDVDHLMTYRL